MQGSAVDLISLVDFIMAARPPDAVFWQGWTVRPVTGGRNNLLYRASHDGWDLAVKVTRRDARDRAGREYHGLALMSACNRRLAPVPLLLDRDRWPQPVVVQTWLDGSTVEKMVGPADWSRLAEYYAAVHQITPVTVAPGLGVPVQTAALNFCTAQEGASYVLDDLRRLPVQSRPPGLDDLEALLAKTTFPEWPSPPCVFGRCDPTLANFLRVMPDLTLASVDWENSGWLDPAFELGDLMTHPSYRDTSPADWQHYLSCCASLHHEDPHLVTRMLAYRAILLVRWAGVFARFWYERDHHLPDPSRLVKWPEEWWQALPAQYERYRQLAEQTLRAFPNT